MLKSARCKSCGSRLTVIPQRVVTFLDRTLFNGANWSRISVMMLLNRPAITSTSAVHCTGPHNSDCINMSICIKIKAFQFRHVVVMYVGSGGVRLTDQDTSMWYERPTSSTVICSGERSIKEMKSKIPPFHALATENVDSFQKHRLSYWSSLY